MSQASTSLFETCMAALAVLVAAYLILPTLIILPMSVGTEPYLNFPPKGFTLHWYRAFFADGDWLAATWFSVKIACLTMVVAVGLGTAVALALVRSDLPAKGLFETLLVVPLILPQIVVALALLLFYQELHLVGSIVAFVASHTCLALPYVVFTISATLRRYEAGLDAAALVCGADRLTIFRRVTLPLIWPSLASSALFAFLISFDEAVVSFFLSGVSDKAIARKFFEDIELNVTPVLAVVASLLTVTTVLVLAVGLAAQRGRAAPGTAAHA